MAVTYTALTTLVGKNPAERLGQALEGMDPAPTGVGVFEVEDGSGLWEVGGYYLERPDDAQLAILTAAFDAKPFSISEVPDIDWVAHVKRELAPVEAGRFYVYGSHDADLVPEDKIPLLIEASMAFGTGHHGTTLGCLTALDRLVEDGLKASSVLDLGCGTAVLAMAAAKTWGNTPIASDIDPMAVDVARANVLANGLEGQVTCVVADGFADPALAEGAPYQLIFANILMGPLMGLADSISKATQPQGFVILSGILHAQAAPILVHFAQFGYDLLHRDDIGEWSTLTLQKFR
ncbi:MAG: 50S ribosomal protein L11 methyltransferase [Pseudomonadota bacterium]